MAGNSRSPFGRPVPGYDDGGSTAPAPAVAAAVAPPVIEAPMTNPESVVQMGMGFRAKHLADYDARTKEVDNVFSKQQLNVDTMSKMLDDTTASLKRSREGRSNLPLMAMGAGMLSSTGGFGEQLGAGMKAMVPAIQKDRSDEEDYQYKLATMAMKRAGVENAPLQDKLAYLRALQVGDEASARAIEVAMLKAQGQTTKTDDKKEIAANALEEKAHKDAMAAALAQIKVYGENNYTTPEQKQEAFLSAYEHAARGFKLPEPLIKTFVEAKRREFDSAKPKGGFTVPGNKPEDIEKAKQLGLGPQPLGSPYANLTNPQDALKTFQVENTEYMKMTKDNSDDSQRNVAELSNLERAEAILKKYPNITGQQASGLIPNRVQVPTAPLQELNSIFTKNQVYGVPQGQGAISNFERDLFERAKPRMDNLPAANLNLITVQKQILQDQIEKRKFMNTYFGHYKTIKGADDLWVEYARSKEGRAGFNDPETGMVVANPARITWQEWMRKQHGDPTQTHARGGQHKAGGAVHLGSEWD